jgi:predicted ATPase
MGRPDNGGVATRVSSPVFVGRRHELDELSAAARTAADGDPTVVLIAGEAGVGKTRLVAELLRTLPPQTHVLAGGCVDVAAGTVPYAPLIEALRELARATPAAELDRLLGQGRADLAGLLPSLRQPGDQPPTTGLA